MAITNAAFTTLPVTVCYGTTVTGTTRFPVKNPILPSGKELSSLEEIRFYSSNGHYDRAINLLLDELDKRQKALDNLTQVLGLKDDGDD